MSVIERCNLLFWPNPAKDHVNIQLSETTGPRIARIRFFDMQGRQVLDVIGSSTLQTTIDLGAQDYGAYVFEAQLDDGSVLSNRLVVVH